MYWGGGGKLMLEPNVHFNDCNQIAKGNSFLRDVLAGWCKINYLEDTQAVAKAILCNNSQITCRDKFLFYSEWYKKGIKLIEHINDFRIK